MEAIILAGGFGTRLRDIVKDIPKPMADIGGRPFLSYLLDYLLRYGITEVFLSVGYKHEVIENYFGAKYKDMNIRYVVEGSPMGTGGALREALKQTDGPDVVAMNGDSFFNLDLKDMIDFHYSHGAMMTIALKAMRNFDRYGSVVMDGDRVIGFEGKVYKDFGYINGGMYVMKNNIFQSLCPVSTNFSLEHDFLNKHIQHIASSAYISNGYFIDIGIPDDYIRARQELKAVFEGGMK
jgi:D-glycero-alpha-D-manno-heptose 1-phosphate guanylyltransferase